MALCKALMYINSMRLMKTSHRIMFIAAVILSLISWGVAVYYWNKLPGVIPIHFGISGKADGWADKSLYYVFLMPFLQSTMLGAFIFLYFKPQYSDIPTTMWLMALDKKHREHAFRLIRVMLVGTSLWIGILFSYMTYAMNYSSVEKDAGISTPIMFSIIGLMMIWLIYWAVKVYCATRSAIADIRKK